MVGPYLFCAQWPKIQDSYDTLFKDQCNPYIRNLIGEVLFILRLMLRISSHFGWGLNPIYRSFSPTLSDEISDIGFNIFVRFFGIYYESILKKVQISSEPNFPTHCGMHAPVHYVIH